MNENEIFGSIIAALWGIILGAFIPIMVAYARLFFKGRKFGFKLIFKLIPIFFLSLILIIVVLSSIQNAILNVWPDIFDEGNIFLGLLAIGGIIGFWGGIILLIIGIRRSRKRRTQKA